MSARLFDPGQILATRAIAIQFEQPALLEYLTRHLSGDWGDLDDEDKQSNTDAIIDGTRIFSAYETPHGKIWIITEADRSSTTILFPSEY